MKCKHFKYLETLITFTQLGFYRSPRRFEEQGNMFIYFKGTGKKGNFEKRD